MERNSPCALLEKKLRSTKGLWERLPILTTLALAPPDNVVTPERTWGYAQEALLLARQLNDRFWIACSLRGVGHQLLRTARYSEAVHNLEQASDLFAQIGEAHRKARTDQTLAMTFIFMGEFNRALPLIVEGLPILRSTDDRVHIIAAFTYLGRIYNRVGDKPNAIRNYRRALGLARQYNRQREAAYTYQELALLYNELGESRIHRTYLFKALAAFITTNNREGIATVTANIASMYLEEKQFLRAKEYVLLSGKLCRQLGLTASEGLAWGQLADIHRHNRNVAEAARCYRKGLTLVQKSEQKVFEGKLYEHFGTLYLEIGQPKRALTYMHRGLEIIAQSGYGIYESDAHQSLATAYETIGDAAKALRHHREYVRLKEAHISERKVLEAGRTEMRMKIQAMGNELKRERANNDKLKEAIEQKEAELLALTLSMIRTEEGMQQKRFGKRNSESSLAATSTHSNIGNSFAGNWEIFARQFHKVHYDFYTDLIRRYPNLTTTEIKVCSLIRIGLSSKEIADILCIAKKTVDKHRVRIHKKLELLTGSSLSGFIAQM